MTDLDSAAIKKTQNSLGKYVKKPALTEKLLRKPPFRFLHDVISVVIKDTGFLKDLYTTEELNSDNVKDRDAKVAYLQKLIDVTKAVTGKELKVRPSKIVAGLEPDKTNELLQAIGYALDKKLDSSSVVESYKTGATSSEADNGRAKADEATVANGTKVKDDKKEDKKSKDRTKDKTKEKDAAKEKEKHKDKLKDREKEKTKRNDEAKKEEVPNGKDKQEKVSKSKDKDKSSHKTDKHGSKGDAKSSSDRKKLEKSRSKDKEKPLKRSESIKEEPVENKMKSDLANNVESSVDNDSKDSLKENQESFEVNGRQHPEDELVAVIDEEAELRRIERSSSRRSSLKKQGSLTPSDNNVLVDLNQYNGLEIQTPSRQNSGIMGEPISRHDSDPVEPIASERQAKQPVLRQQSVDSVMRPRTSLRPPSVRPPSARPGAPRRKEKNVEIVLQPNETTKLGEINVKMEVFNNELLDDDGENLIVIEDPAQVDDLYNAAGTAVAESKEEQEQGHLVQQILETQKEFSHVAGSDAGSSEMSKKIENEWTTNQRQSSAKQMEAMRDSIQKLTRSVNPLGKLMDFLQEDIDSMERELTNWQQVYSKAAVELSKERSANENAVEPLKHQLAQIETNIREYQEMIDMTRANILQNEQKIERLYMTEI